MTKKYKVLKDTVGTKMYLCSGKLVGICSGSLKKDTIVFWNKDPKEFPLVINRQEKL